MSLPAALRRATSLAAPFVIAVLLCSCEVLGLDPKSDRERELARQRRVWNARGLTNYQYVLQRLCFCGGEYTRPVLVTVRAGAVASVVYAENGGAVPAFASDVPSVQGLFDIIEEAIDEGVYQLTVEYDDEFGYPTTIGIDHAVNVADDEITYNASTLLALPPDLRR